jgi:hypothetical protein
VAYDRKFLRWTWGFHDASPTEETAYTSLHTSGINTNYDPVPDLSALTTSQMDDLLTSMFTLLTYSSFGWADYSYLEHLKVAAVDVNGHYLTDPKIRLVGAGTWKGETATTHPQLSVVMTLWSGATLGKGNYGRMYLPHTAMPLATTGSTSTSGTADSCVTHALTFLGDVNTLAGSLTTGAGLRIPCSVGFSRPVAKVRFGRVTDTQQRRRRQLDESPSTGTL